MPASASFTFDDGMTTVSWNATFAFRRRVSMSAIGSVIVTVAPSSPRCLGNAGDLPCVRELAQADATQTEASVDRARPTAFPATGIAAHFELRCRLLFVD